MPFVLSGVLGWFGTKTALSIDQRDTAFKNMKNTFLAKTYMVLILSAVCGGVGFFGGDYIEKNHMGDAPQELRNNLKVFFQWLNETLTTCAASEIKHQSVLVITI